MHLIVDGQAKNLNLMTDKAKMSNYLRTLVEATGMSIFQEPIVVGYPWPGSTDTSTNRYVLLNWPIRYATHWQVILSLRMPKRRNWWMTCRKSPS